MKRAWISLFVIGPILTGLLITTATLAYRTFAHISTIYPEYSSLDSVYIDARGLPYPMWVKNDPARSGYGEKKKAILWPESAYNWSIWAFCLYVAETPAIVILTMIAYRKKQTSANKAFEGNSSR